MIVYIVKSNKTSLDNVNKKINDWMKNNITNYHAVRWGKIIKNMDTGEYALEVKEDSRNPLSMLTDNDKTQIIQDQLTDSGWYKTVKDIDGTEIQTLNYVE